MPAARNYVRSAGAWVPSTFLPAGGTMGQVLVKSSGTDYAAAWETPAATSVVGSTQEQPSAGLTVATTAYTIGDTLGSGWTFPTMAAAAGGVGKITGVRMYDKADVLSSVTLWLYAAAVTFGTDNLAPGISDADQANVIGSIALGFTDLGASRVASVDSIAFRYHCAATSLFVYAVTNTGHTFFGNAADVPLRLYYEAG